MKVIFLDIDGVLNDYYYGNQKYMTSNPDIEEITTIEKEKTNFVKKVIEKNWGVNYSSGQPVVSKVLEIDSDKIHALNRIVKETGSKIVFSTAWRGSGTENLAFLLTLKEFNYPLDCIGCTPILYDDRGIEIQAWLNCKKGLVDRYAVLDDDTVDIFKHHEDENVFNIKGLTEDDADRIIKHLNQ